MSRQIKVPNVSPLVAGKKVTIDLDVGWKYLVVHIKRTNITAVQATGFAFKINGKIEQSLDSLQDLEDINTHYNRPQIAGITSLFFKRPELADSEDRDLTGLGTRDIQSAQIEFILDAAVLLPDIAVVAEVTSNENIGWITKLEKSDINLSKVGINVVGKMPVGDGQVFAYFMQKLTNDITDIELTRVVDGVKNNVIESTKEFLEVEQKQAPMRPRVPVTATVTAIDFTTSGVPEDALQTETIILPDGGESYVERIGMNITVGTAETISVITESVGQFRG